MKEKSLKQQCFKLLVGRTCTEKRNIVTCFRVEYHFWFYYVAVFLSEFIEVRQKRFNNILKFIKKI